MLRKFLAPLHPDGWKFVAAAIVLAILLFFLWIPLGWIGLIAAAWVAYFFRDPWRVTPTRPGLLVSPADGLVVSVAEAVPPAELEMGPGPFLRVGIFLNVFDVHVNRVPVGGKVKALRYRKGKFVSANLDKASDENERMAVRIAAAEGPDIAFVQIAGLVARRIRCYLREGETVVGGQRMGLIRFGSRVDVYCPAPYVPLVIVGQRVIGGETVLADRLVQEPPRQGISH